MGEPSPSQRPPPSPSIELAAGGEWPGGWSWAKPCIFTNKSDMKPVPLWVLWEKEKGHYVTEEGCTPLGLAWQQSARAHVWRKPVLQLTHLVAQPWDREDRNPTLKSPVYSLWGLGHSYPYKALGSNPAHDSCRQCLWMPRLLSWPPSLSRTMGIHCLQVGWRCSALVCGAQTFVQSSLTQATLCSEGED